MRHTRDLLHGTGPYPRVIAIGRKIYIGSVNVIQVYDTYNDDVKELPSLNYLCYGMTAHNSQLVVVGGERSQYHTTSKLTNALCVWDSQHNMWTHPYPPMIISPTSRSSVISYNRFILVIGGGSRRGEDDKYIARVEILDTTTGQWYQTTPLPEPCSNHALTSSCVIGNMYYMVSGTNVFTASLDQLISNAVLPLTGATPLP